jgi:uncharacterized protein (TIGR03083 family)
VWEAVTNTLDPSPPVVSATAVPLDPPSIRATLDAVARRLVELLEAVPDPQAPTRGLTWTLGETGLHVAGAPALFADFARGRARPEPTIDLGPVNARRMAAAPERAPSALAGQLDTNTRRYLAETAELPATHPVPFFGGVTIELAAQSAILLGEFVVHGYDVARSIGRPWPIDPAHARLIVTAVTALVPRYVDQASARGLTATYEVRLRDGPSFQVRFDSGAAAVGPSHARAADCRLTVDPVTFLLVAYGRRSQWPGILRGQLRAWGRRPWLGPRFQRLFIQP